VLTLIFYICPKYLVKIVIVEISENYIKILLNTTSDSPKISLVGVSKEEQTQFQKYYKGKYTEARNGAADAVISLSVINYQLQI